MRWETDGRSMGKHGKGTVVGAWVNMGWETVGKSMGKHEMGDCW